MNTLISMLIVLSVKNRCSLEEFKVLHNELLKEHDTRRPNSATSLRRTTIKGIKPSTIHRQVFGIAVWSFTESLSVLLFLMSILHHHDNVEL